MYSEDIAVTGSQCGRRGWLLLLFVFTLPCLPTAADAQAPLAGMDLVRVLRDGGHVLYFRHEATDWSQDDHVEGRDDLSSCDPERMRQLSDAGRERARRTGEAMRALGIPVGGVLASPYCRTVETATLMDLGPVRTTPAVMNLRAADYAGGRSEIVARARALLSAPPPAGTNIVVVAHGNVAREATEVYPGEGEGVAFEPMGDGRFRVVGRLTPAQWHALSQAAPQ